MKYRVLKEFISPIGSLVEPDSQPIDDLSYPMMTEALLKNGFIEEIKDEPWKPKEGEKYYSLDPTGSVTEWVAYGSESSKVKYRLGNCFQTKEQAEKAVKWLKAFKVLRDDTKGFEPDWEDPDQDKFMVFYDHTDKYFGILEHCDTQAELIIFATGTDAKESIKKHRLEWLTFLNI